MVIGNEEHIVEIKSERIIELMNKTDKISKNNGRLGNLVKKIRKPIKPRRKRFETKLIA